MPIADLFAEKKLVLSYELFPPKTSKGEAALHEQVSQLMHYSPDFVTCTYGAGGSSRHRTLAIIDQVKQRFQLPVASHLTCVGSTRDDLRDYLNRALRQGVDFIVALRGDPPQGAQEFLKMEGGLSFASELVALIHDEFPQFDVLVAGYPETHREATSATDDLQNLKRKVDAGADAVVTQLFYNNDDFFRFRDQCTALGINVPIVPGILPITSLQQIQRITSLCGARLPLELESRLSSNESSQWQFDVGVEWAIRQTQQLIDAEVPGLHFYVLNQSPATVKIIAETQLAELRQAM